MGETNGQYVRRSFIRGCAAFLYQILLFLCLFVLLFLPKTTQVEAQRRPLLLNTSRDYFAGRLLLIPQDVSPQSLQQPRMLARIADHDLITPPVRLMGNQPEIREWAKKFDYAEVDGVILSLDAIAGDGEIARLARAHRRGIPIYGFTTSRTQIQTALNLVKDNTLDFLLIAGAGTAALTNEIVTLNLTDRVAIDDGADSVSMMLLARLLNRRFGISPKIVPAYLQGASSTVQGENRRLNTKIKTIDGLELPQTADAALAVDAILFLHTPQMTDTQRINFVGTIEQTIDKGTRVAVADLSENKESKDALIAALRSRKLFDKLIAYASDFSANSSGDAINRALTHASTLTVAFRFLRDDLTRVRRIDNAQITLLFNRYLSDWAYPSQVRPALDSFVREELKSDPDRLGTNQERAVAFATERLKPIVEEIFKQQFHRNAHAILLSRGERVVFEINMIQRFQMRFSSSKTSEAEIIVSLYVPQVTFPELPQSLPRAEWTLVSNQIDGRIQKRMDSVAWDDFKTGTESVEVNIKVQPKNESPEAYRIVSTRKRKTLRIEITASSEQGAFYAIGKLEQMGASGLLNNEFQINESPSFPRRGIVEGFDGSSWTHRGRLEILQFLGRVRMNRYYYAPKGDPLSRQRWRQAYSSEDLGRFKQLVQAANENFVEFVYSIAPGLSITYSSEADLTELIRKIDSMTEIGVKHFSLAFDDLPETLQKEEDRKKFKTLAAAHVHLINRVYNHFKQKMSGFELSIVPTVYSGTRGDSSYLKELGAAIPSGVLIFWTGAEHFSREYSNQQARDWKVLVGRPPLIWDNFPVNDQKNWRLFLGAKRGVSPTLGAEVAGFIANPMSQLRASMPALATTAQYAWDPRSYDPARALESALNLLYDERTQTALRSWISIYGDYHHDTNLFESLFSKSRDEIDLRSRESKANELQKALELIAVRRDQGLLRGELAQIAIRTQAAIERIKNDPAYEKLPNGNYRLRK